MKPRRGATSRSTTAAARSRPRPTRVLVVTAVLAAAVVLGWLALRTAAPGAPARPRNVLLITLDTTRADHLGCYGRRPSRTPNLDRLAAEGARFTRCTTCSPLTLPSHSSILTGLYPFVHGARQNGTGRLAPGNQTIAEVLAERGFGTAATVASFVLNARFGTAQGFAQYHDVQAGGGNEAERRGDEVCDDALRLLAGLKDRPFFLWVHFYDPHFPYLSPRTTDVLSPLAYEDEVAFMDAQIGRLLDGLRAAGRERDTLVVAVADHGEGLNDHDEWKHGYFLYETTIHTPLLLRCPGIVPAGAVIDAQVRTIDLAPTMLDLLGVDGLPQAQGTSLAGLLRGAADPGLLAYSEALEAYHEYRLSPLRSLSAGAWKFILAPESELYDVLADPREQNNRLADEAARGARMRADLRQVIADSPPPPPPEEVAVQLQPSESAVLASLGYVGAAGTPQAEGSSELERFEPVGGNPRDFARSFKFVSWELPQLLRRRDYARAEELLRPLMEQLPQAAYLYGHLAMVVEQQGRADEAAAAYRRAVDLAPDDYNMRMKYGVFLRRTQQPEAALAQFALVTERWPDDLDALKHGALVLMTLGRLDEAEPKLRRALEIDARNASLLRVMGLLREAQGRLPEAVEYFNRALAVQPDFPECRQELERVLRALGA